MELQRGNSNTNHSLIIPYSRMMDWLVCSIISFISTVFRQSFGSTGQLFSKINWRRFFKKKKKVSAKCTGNSPKYNYEYYVAVNWYQLIKERNFFYFLSVLFRFSFYFLHIFLLECLCRWCKCFSLYQG